MVGGLGAGLGFVVLMEMLNRSIRRPVDLSARLGIQPFATIPYIRTQGETRWKRGAVIAALAVIVVAIPAGLYALHSYYLPLDLLLEPAAGADRHRRPGPGLVTGRNGAPKAKEDPWNASRLPSRRPRNAAATRSRPRARRSRPARPCAPAGPRRSPRPGPPGPSSRPSSPIRG